MDARPARAIRDGPNLLSSVHDRLPDFVDRDQLPVRAFTTGPLV
jgi:hypothetical protein